MNRLLATLLLAASLSAHAEGLAGLPVEEEAKALVGVELIDPREELPVAEHLSCRYVGGGSFFIGHKPAKEWASSVIRCQDRYVLTLDKSVGSTQSGKMRRRVVDALLLPPLWLFPDEEHPDGPFLYDSTAEDCTLDGRRGTTVMAVARHGKQKKMTWRNGLEAAWTFDVQQGRIVPLSPKRVVCTRADPD
jgi:hypothetical protein